jgi:hypothetical protein
MAICLAVLFTHQLGAKKSPAMQGKGVFAHFCAGGGNVTLILFTPVSVEVILKLTVFVG